MKQAIVSEREMAKLVDVVSAMRDQQDKFLKDGDVYRFQMLANKLDGIAVARRILVGE